MSVYTCPHCSSVHAIAGEAISDACTRKGCGAVMAPQHTSAEAAIAFRAVLYRMDFPGEAFPGARRIHPVSFDLPIFVADDGVSCRIVSPFAPGLAVTGASEREAVALIEPALKKLADVWTWPA